MSQRVPNVLSNAVLCTQRVGRRGGLILVRISDTLHSRPLLADDASMATLTDEVFGKSRLLPTVPL